LEAGNACNEQKEFVLQDGERLIGIKAKLRGYDNSRLDDVVFVIGKD
jgi:hypothetical protein